LLSLPGATTALSLGLPPAVESAPVQRAGRGTGPLTIARVDPIVIRTPLDKRTPQEIVAIDAVGKSTGARGLQDRLDHSSPSRSPGYEQAVVVKITTKDGMIGWGECHAPTAPAMHAQIVRDLFAPLLIGQDARQVEALWQRMYKSERVRGYSTGAHLEAISGVDLALWDLLGKYAGVPVYQLLGGRYRDQIATYATFSATYTGRDTGETVPQRARKMVDAGFTVIKMALRQGPGTRVFDEAAEVARAIAPKAQLAVDSLGAFTLAEAVRAGKELDRLGNIAWFEDPLLPDQMLHYPELARAVDTAICAGEALSNRFQFRDLLQVRGVDMINPDLCRCGGITEGRRIVWLADLFGAVWAPHVSTGTAPYMAASVHLAVATPNAVMMEVYDGYKHEGPFGNRLLQAPLDFGPGYARVPERPGLGVEFDSAALATVTVG
jgi:L-alanine-DL-glutamate epimerase-like enolase superfamily enzyme